LTKNLFKIPQRAGVDKIPLTDLLKIHLDVEVDPKDGKSSCVCAKCALKILNARTLIEFIRTAINRENTDKEGQGEQRFKQMNIVSPQRSIKNLVPIYSSPSTSKQSSLPQEIATRLSPVKRPLLFSERIEPNTMNTPAAKRELASTSQQLTSFHLSKENPSCLPPVERPLLLTESSCSRFNTNPPKQEAHVHRRSKSKHSPENSLACNQCHFGLSRELRNVIQVVNLLLRSDELCCPFNQSAAAVAGATNTANARQWEAVTVSLISSPPHPYAMNPTATTHRHFVLSPVSLASRDQDGRLSNSTIGIYDLREK